MTNTQDTKIGQATIVLLSSANCHVLRIPIPSTQAGHRKMNLPVRHLHVRARREFDCDQLQSFVSSMRRLPEFTFANSHAS